MSAVLAPRPTLEQAHGELQRELSAALRDDATRIVAAPGFPKANSAADLVLDDFSGASGEQSLLGLLAIVGEQARLGNAQAKAWVEAVAKRHAEYHAPDLLAVWRGEA